jgi:hypothetical protein
MIPHGVTSRMICRHVDITGDVEFKQSKVEVFCQQNEAV